MKLVRYLPFWLCFMLVVVSSARAQSSPAQAFENVTIHTADGNEIQNAALVWRDGVIEAAGSNIAIPFDAYVIDGGDSLHIYPGFIDGLALWGSPDLPDRYDNPDRPGEPGYERAGIQPQRKPSDLLESKDKEFGEAQKTGFTTAALGLKGQMLPGQVEVFFINGSNTANFLMVPGAGVLASFDQAPGGFGSGAYPATTMGVMARYRQLWYDARALNEQENYFASTSANYPAADKDKVLESLFPVMEKTQPLFFEVDTKENIERLFRLQDELEFDLVVVSGKEAHEKAEDLRKRDIPVLASFDLPDKPEWKVKAEEAEEDTVETAEEMQEVSEEMKIFRERQLQAYKESVDNVKKLLEAGVKVGYASNGMKLSDFSKQITTLKEESELSDRQLLQIVTQNTADILDVGSRTGDLTQGRIANFSVFTKPFSEKESKVVYSVSAGVISEFETNSSKK